jgi:hypothetical protein
MRLPYSVALVGALLCAAGGAYAQQTTSPSPAATAPAATSTPPASTTPPATPAPQTSSANTANGPSPEMVQKAKDAGMKQETHGGTTYFCWKAAEPGSRLPTKQCVNDSQLQAELDRRQRAKEQFQQSAAPGMASK